jgi:hypothetical protein
MEIEQIVAEARKALKCLRLEVPASIADDVSSKVEAAFTALTTAQQNVAPDRLRATPYGGG